MDSKIPGIHHITAIAGHPQKNIDFYTVVLGLRLIKLTVNFDDPGTYHFYYGDEAGNPGTILTFFPWPSAPRGRRGAGQATAIAFAVPQGSLEYWIDRLTTYQVKPGRQIHRFGDLTVAFSDPDGLLLELVEHPQDASPSTHQNGVPPEAAIRGFHSITLSERAVEPTAILLTDVLGFTFVGQEGERSRYRAGSDGMGTVVDVLHQPEEPAGRVAVGTVHHVAWRTPNDEEQIGWRETIASEGFNVSPIMDRAYFHSIYFHEPGGVLFEIATDPPGFAVDEPPDQIGKRLMLPPWMEQDRTNIERALAPLKLPQ